MTRKQKKTLIRIIAAAAVLIAVAVLDHSGWRVWLNSPIPLLTEAWTVPAGEPGYALLLWPLYLIPYFLVGWDVLWKAIRNIAHGQVFDENFLMSIATIGALILGEYAEAVGVMLFYQVGELFQSYAVGKSRRSIAQLMDIRPDSARVERDGEFVEVDPDEVAIGELIEVRPGEKIPLDGMVESGNSAIDTAALTGESAPRDVGEGDEVSGGEQRGGDKDARQRPFVL